MSSVAAESAETPGERRHSEHQLEARALLLFADAQEPLKLRAADVHVVTLPLPLDGRRRARRARARRRGKQHRVYRRGAGRDSQCRTQSFGHPRGDGAAEPAVDEPHAEQIACEPFTRRRVDRLNANQPGEERERTLKLRKRLRAARLVELGDQFGLLNSCDVNRRRPDPHPLERQHQHGKGRVSADGCDRIGRFRRRHRRSLWRFFLACPCRPSWPC